MSFFRARPAQIGRDRSAGRLRRTPFAGRTVCSPAPWDQSARRPDSFAGRKGCSPVFWPFPPAFGPFRSGKGSRRGATGPGRCRFLLRSGQRRRQALAPPRRVGRAQEHFRFAEFRDHRPQNGSKSRSHLALLRRLIDGDIGQDAGKRVTGRCFNGLDELPHRVEHRHFAPIEDFTL
jgi:hypothetical protein